ncbi:MAG TPA: S1 RNA-binding domain-containing protein, partial [Armatimonadota bacterium]|nr:S1 RNA-binding domain-containing protein [Armatimonadota bacterium]
KAVQFINTLVRDPEIGEVYDGTVTRLMSFGAFVELVPGKEGLLHVSEYAWERTPSIADVLKVGDPVRVKVSEIDDQGRINVSRKQLLDRPEGVSDSPSSSRGREGGDHPRTPRRRGGSAGREEGPRGGAGGGRTRFREKR